MVDPDRQGPHREETARLPSPPLLNATFFYSFPYCKISVINSCLTVYLQIVMLLLERNGQPELPDCEGRYTPFLCIILSKQLYTAVVLQCECHIIKHHFKSLESGVPNITTFVCKISLSPQ